MRRHEIDRLFDRLFEGSFGFGLLPWKRERELAAGYCPSVDIYEDREGLSFNVELPGVDPKMVDVRVEDGSLIVSGERKLEREDKRENYQRVESYYGTFMRSFTLPPSADAEKIKAEYRNGLLKIFLPKREEAKPKQVKVKIEG